MKTLFYILTLLVLISCGKKNSNQIKSAVDTLVDSSKVSDNNYELKKYIADGLFLKGEVSVYDNNQKRIGKLQIIEIEPTQILEKSTKMFNIDGSTDKCQKAFFLKVKYKEKDYLIFGQDVYEINNQQKFPIQNDKKEKLTLFHITNFVMGASDEIGLTDCDDFSLLVLLNERKNHYSLMKYPMNEDIHGVAGYKYASLFHDDGSEEKIYKVTVMQDTLVIGIKATYQEGGSIFNLKTILSNEFPETRISDRIRFETDEDLKKMDKIK